MEKRIRVRQWDRELNVLNTENFSERKMKLRTILQNHHRSWKYHRKVGKYDGIFVGMEFYF